MSSAASVEGDGHARLFCALTLAGDTLDGLVDWQHRLPAGDFRLVPRDNLHVTLAFLGRRPAGEADAIRAELEASVRAAGPIVLRPLRYRETRTVGMLVLDDEDGAATALAVDLHRRLQRLGVYEPEQRAWLPHLTIVRFRGRPRLRPELPRLGGVSPSGAAVYHSVLRSAGAQYVVLHAISLSQS